MRSTYGAIFVGFAVVGFASVFNLHKARPVPPASVSLPATAAPDSAIKVQTNLIEPEIVQREQASTIGYTAHANGRAPQPLRQRLRGSRSLLARVVLGDGQFRPQPFPTPGLK